MPGLRRASGGEQQTTTLELFFDLVYVFAITQVSHLLVAHLDWSGAGQAALVLAVVWWAWNYTTWATNELDPDSIVVRGLIVALMLGSLAMAVAIPDAFGDRALLFALAYVGVQVGRQVFLTFVAARAGTMERERALHILVWFAASGVLWIAGGLAHGVARTLLWCAALGLDYAAALLTYPVPGLAPVPPSAWNVEVSHFAERFQLFVIIALGESIVVIGATTSELELTAARSLAFATAFLTTAAMWWLYFDYVAAVAQRRLELAADRTEKARNGYTYLHGMMVAGVVVAAVGDELIVAHPTEHLHAAEVVAVVAGPALYLLAHTLFRLAMAGTLSRKRLAGAAGCAACGLLGPLAPAVVVALALLGVLVAVIVAEHHAGAKRSARGEQSPLEALASEG